ncbi:hypothetical protein RQP53_06620 [Paucibacter sp. APW11]|uniref:Uncharacterized protein n=1 Tax=Roseateles aquae TaxID=3077235 RepID=A0ABU3P8X0_9BURK|nr:hypothetical protein [Paucibacter sp. APW11]MDT8998938.1 hypothetical protein [Paucibacter sp. APW11]
MKRRAGETRPAADGPVEQLLVQLRHSMIGWQEIDGPQRIAEIRAFGPTAAEHLELEALGQFFSLTDDREFAQQQLQYAKDLQEAANQLGAVKAEAAAWRLMHGLQTMLKMHQAALHSAGTAATLYRSCGETMLAHVMTMSRMNVFFQLELYQEQLDTTLRLMDEADDLAPPFLHRAINSAAGACYCLAYECQEESQHQHWLQQSKQYQQRALRLAAEHELLLLGTMSRLNLSVVHAMLGEVADAREQIAALDQADSPIAGRPGWQAWRRLSVCITDAQDHGVPLEQSWPALLQLAQDLGQEALNDSAAREACLHAIVRIGPRRGQAADAFRASQQLLMLQRQHRRSLSHALGDTIGAVMAQPQLLEQHQLLVEKGSVLEQALAQRNAELSSALAKLQTEAAIRQSAEAALQRAHAELEQQVQQRSAELHQATRTLMQQEKQLSLSRLVAASAAEMSEPLNRAHEAAAQVLAHRSPLEQALAGVAMRRSELEQLLDSLDGAGAVTDAALERVAQLVQRFKALDGQA